MKKLALILLAAASFCFTGCEVEKDIDSKEYSFDMVIPITASGSGQVESSFYPDVDYDQEVSDASEGKATMDDVSSIRVKEARIEVLDADNENNVANFSRATLNIGRASGGHQPVSASRDIPDQYNTQIHFGDAFGDQNLKEHISDWDDVEYKVRFDARRATTKETHALLKIKFVMHVKYKAYF